MSRKRHVGGNPPAVIQVVNGGAGFQVPNIAQPVVAAIQDPLSSTLSMLNANPYLIGVFYLFLNLGGRFLSLELTKRQEWFLSQPILRPFILFAVMFISTRNLSVAFWTTVGILSVLWVFANENSAFCIIPGWKEKPPAVNYDANMSKLKKIETPEDGHHEEIKPVNQEDVKHIDVPHTEVKHDDKQTEVKHDDKQTEVKHDDKHEDYVNDIKDDPVGHNDIKENFASY